MRIVKKMSLLLGLISLVLPLILLGDILGQQAKKQSAKHSGMVWPTPIDWQGLKESVQGRLIEVKPPLPSCAGSQLCALQNPFFLEEQPGATQSAGWLNAWISAVSPYAVVAENSQDVIAAINFAKKHHLKLVIKGTGHDYLGRSNAKDSLLLWTHKMRKVSLCKRFCPVGSPADTIGVTAVNVEAGTRWLEVYQEVTTKHSLYVQGGGCTSVGAAGGFLQGGGFGSFSKKYGLAAASLLEAEIVTADGKILIANAYQNQDLFWALKGGGGGTFGVVTRVMLKTHKLPKTFGVLEGKLATHSSKTFKNLLKQFIIFYHDKLNNEHWGEQIRINNDNSINLVLVFQGLSKEEAEAVWKPFLDSIKKNGYSQKATFNVMPAKKMWNYSYLKKHFHKYIQYDKNKSTKGLFWWAGDSSQVSMFWYTYQSRWLPLKLFEPNNAKKLAEILFKASRVSEGSVELHINKGLAGASEEVMKNRLKTSINPVVYDSAALLIMSAGKPLLSSGMENINEKEAKTKVQKIDAAMQIIAQVTPNSGSYLNETDYFQKNWQEAFWGINYSKLLEIKQYYDPDNIFNCHHSVGSKE